MSTPSVSSPPGLAPPPDLLSHRAPHPPGAPVRRRRSILRRLVPPPVRRRVDRFDLWADRQVDHLRGRPTADRLFYAASELGDFSLIWLLIGAAQGLRDDRSFRRAVRLGAALAVESALVNGLIKSTVRRTRPVLTFERPLRLRAPRTSSFPSGHASAGFAAAALLSDGDRALRPLYYAVAAVVATSRVHVKIHHASDVVAGAVVGAAFGAAVVRAWPLDRVPDPAAIGDRRESPDPDRG